MVFAYDFCDVVVVYHPFGGDHLCDTLHFYHGYIADLSKENDADDVVLEI